MDRVEADLTEERRCRLEAIDTARRILESRGGQAITVEEVIKTAAELMPFIVGRSNDPQKERNVDALVEAQRKTTAHLSAISSAWSFSAECRAEQRYWDEQKGPRHYDFDEMRDARLVGCALHILNDGAKGEFLKKRSRAAARIAILETLARNLISRIERNAREEGASAIIDVMRERTAKGPEHRS